MEEFSDESLIELLASAEESENDRALKHIYKAHYNLIEQYILKNSGDTAAAADIFQDGLIVLYNKVRNPQFELTSALSTYLYAVCRNLWLKKLRSTNKEVQLDDSFLQNADEGESNIAAIIRTERSDLIADLMGKMTDDCRNILLYFYFEQLRMKAIMERMDISSEAVAKNKKMNCLKSLRKMIMESPWYFNALRK